MKAATDIDGLLAWRHEDFVECAYRTILQRPADPDGQLHYTKRVLNGDPKMEILRDLHASEEARAVGVELPWLRRAIARYESRDRPFRRLTRKLLIFRSARAQLADRLRTIDEKVSYFERHSTKTRSELTERIRTMEERLSAFEGQSATMRAQLDQVLELLNNPESNRQSLPVVGAPSGQGHAFLGKSLVTKRILRDMSTAIREAKGDSGLRPLA